MRLLCDRIATAMLVLVVVVVKVLIKVLIKEQRNLKIPYNQLCKTWSLNLRLKRWVNNGFNKQKNRFPDHYDSLLMKRLDISAQKEYEQHLKAIGYVTEYNPNAGAKWVKK